MSSNTSPWTAFTSEEQGGPEPGGTRGTPFRTWQTAIAFPILLAILIASAAAPLIHMFLNKDFGLTSGRDAPSMLGLAFVGLVGFWSSRWISPRITNVYAWGVTAAVLWLASVSVWLLLETEYDFRGLLRDPGSLVSERGYFVVPLFLAFGAWWIGTRYGADPGRFMPEEIRGLVQRCWMVLVGSIVLAAMIGGGAGQMAIDAAHFAVPLCMISSVALVAGTEVDSTRKMARKRGGDIPGWGRWYRLSGGFALAILAMSVIVLGILSPGAMRAILDGIQSGLRGIGTVIGYLLYAVVYVLYLLVRAGAAVLEWLFGDLFGPIQPPEMTPQQQGQGQMDQQQQTEPEPFAHAELLRWIAIGIAVVIVGIIILRVSRRGELTDDGGPIDEERESLFSGDLAKRQLRNLFRRKAAPVAPERLDLDRPPTTAREAMVYLEVLAQREGVERRDDETPRDFVARLRADWAGTGGALGDLLTTYQPVRYGDLSDDPGSALSAEAAGAWEAIWRQRKVRLELKDEARHAT